MTSASIPEPLPSSGTVAPPARLPPIKHTPSKAALPQTVNARPAAVGAFTICSVLALLIGWQIRDEYFITAETGVGYYLGIAGGTMMLLLLLYPLRKRFYQSTYFVLSTRSWFKLHMALGIIGPICILYHCNFSLGSSNSNVALASMLLMVFSGLVGRFIYRSIHFGLYGEKITLGDLQNRLLAEESQLVDGSGGAKVVLSDAVMAQLKHHERLAVKGTGILLSLVRIMRFGITTRWAHFRLVKQIKREQTLRETALTPGQLALQMREVRLRIWLYFATLRKIAGLSFYERLFSLWHMLHLPIFFMLIVTGFIHVYAVHAY